MEAPVHMQDHTTGADHDRGRGDMGGLGVLVEWPS
jgi:hypothetical protein